MENLIAGLFGILIGAVGLWTGIRQLRNRALFNDWKTTNGKVIERGVYQPDGAMLSVPAFRFAPLVRYTYQVDGREFENNSILPVRIQLPQHSSRKWAQRKAGSFADEVTVHYNPEDASESYLVLTSKLTLYTVVAASCLLIAVGGLFLLSFASK